MSLQLQDVCFSYGKTPVLKHISATLEHGVYGLLGANGAGKTTLISLLVKLRRPASGHIFLDGQDIFTEGVGYFDHIGYLPQSPRFYPQYTIRDFLRYMAAIKGMPKAMAYARCDELLAFVNLAEEAHKKVGACSGGMRQRVGIAQALLNDPELLILDEPTAGLDPLERIRFRNLVARLGESRTVLLATHIVPDVEHIAREVFLLRRGELIGQGSPAALAASLHGGVWQITVQGEAEVADCIRRFPVSNVQQEAESYCLRVVSDTPPTPDSQPLAPRLEDVYLHLFGEEGDGDAAVSL